MRVALCQFNMAWEDWRSNLRRAEQWVARADADLVILPEMFATGFVTDPERVAQPMSGEIVGEMQRWARRYGRAVAGSVIIEEGGRFFNRFLFVYPAGEIVQSDKRHLFSIGGEGKSFVAGNLRTIVEYGGLRFLLLVCYDLRFPVWSRCRNDYDAVIYVASWPESRRTVWRTLLRARAIENEAYVLGVNRTGSDPTARYSGDSAAVGFRGETLTEAGAEETLLTVDLDPEALHAFREKFPAWRDADRFELHV
ncbi:nitrilase family protein [uncultured Alistipes sp.]|uniref:nitrilase family protein n=1 Tax=uncultured Alistipes sp. TaxID=538949 RepID=UPI002605E2F7|nr:nitrilase family protein [uncultured Alistipes sp.]